MPEKWIQHKITAFCRNTLKPRYIWTFSLCTPFPILYQSQASLLTEASPHFGIHHLYHILKHSNFSVLQNSTSEVIICMFPDFKYRKTDRMFPVGFFCCILLPALVMPRRGEAVCPVFLQCASVRQAEEEGWEYSVVPIT